MQYFLPPRTSYGYKYFEVSIIRPIDAEPELSAICKAMDLLFQHCTQSVKAIGGTLAAKYLVSFEPGKTRMKEFRLLEDTKKTFAIYTRLPTISDTTGAPGKCTGPRMV